MTDHIRMMSEREAQAYIGLKRNKTREWCEKIGATRHIGRRVLFDRKIIDEALDNLENKKS